MDFSTVKDIAWQQHKTWTDIGLGAATTIIFMATSQAAAKRIFGQGSGAVFSKGLVGSIVFGAWYTFGIGDLLPRTLGGLALLAESARQFRWAVKQIPTTPEAALAQGALARAQRQLRGCTNAYERQDLQDEVAHLNAEIAGYSDNVADRAIIGSVNSKSRWLLMKCIFEISAVALTGVAIVFTLTNKAWTSDQFAAKYFGPAVSDVSQYCASSQVAGVMATVQSLFLFTMIQIPRLPLLFRMGKDLVKDRKQWLSNMPYYAFTAAWYNLAPQAMSGNWLMIPFIGLVAQEFFKGRMGLYEKKDGQEPRSVPLLQAIAKPEAEYRGVLGMLKTLMFTHLGSQWNMGMQAARLTLGGRSAVAISQSGLACAVHASLPAAAVGAVAP